LNQNIKKARKKFKGKLYTKLGFVLEKLKTVQVNGQATVQAETDFIKKQVCQYKLQRIPIRLEVF